MHTRNALELALAELARGACARSLRAELAEGADLMRGGSANKTPHSAPPSESTRYGGFTRLNAVRHPPPSPPDCESALACSLAYSLMHCCNVFSPFSPVDLI